MGFSTLVHNLVQTVKQIVDSLEVSVTLEKYIEDETFPKTAGRRTYEDPVSYKVIIIRTTKYVPIDGGVQGVQVSSVQFLDPLKLSVRDRITLPDGSHPQIVSVNGAVDPDGVYYAPKAIF